MHDVVPGLGHEVAWVLVQLTYWPQPEGYEVFVPGILPEGAAGRGLLSLVLTGGGVSLAGTQLIGATGVVPRRLIKNPRQ